MSGQTDDSLAGKELSFSGSLLLFASCAATSAVFRRKNATKERTSIIGNKVCLPNYLVTIFIGGDMGVDK
jgi:hypothetical protein